MGGGRHDNRRNRAAQMWIQPSSDLLLYGDNADVNAAIQANQIDAALYDLPTALYLSAVVIEGSKVIGQFDASASGDGDEFGMLMEDGNPLKTCVDEALAALTARAANSVRSKPNGFKQTTGVPLVK